VLGSAAARQGAQQLRDAGGEVARATGEALGEIRVGVAHRGDDTTHRAHTALTAAGGEARTSPTDPSEPTGSCEATGRHGHGRDGGGHEALGLITYGVGWHASYFPAPIDSTRRLSSLSAVSMIIFSALRLNMPSMPIARSTASV